MFLQIVSTISHSQNTKFKKKTIILPIVQSNGKEKTEE